MSKSLLRKPLYPFVEGRNFQVGAPTNGTGYPHEGPETECRCPDRNYSGADPQIQFPAGWHVVAGYGGKSGGFHQDCSRFFPEWVRVIRDPRKNRNLIEAHGGDAQSTGKVAFVHWFDRPVGWVPQSNASGVLAEFVFRTVTGLDQPLYWNFELRGILSFAAHKNESAECIGVHLLDHKIMCAYWLNAADGSRVEDRREVKEAFTLLPHKWYRLQIAMTPTREPHEWHTRVDLRVANKKTPVWSLETRAGEHPNGIDAINHVFFGKERERFFDGGRVWQTARAMCWTGGE